MTDPNQRPDPVEPNGPSDPSRRRFIQAVGIGLAAPALMKLGACGDDTSEGPVLLAEGAFPQGIASGDPRADSVVLWARVVDPAATGDLAVTLIVSKKDSLTSPIAKIALSASPDNDHVVKVMVSGLDPATIYYYRFVYEAESRFGSRIARTRTAPAAEADVDVRVAIASCQDFVGRQFNSYAQLLQIVDSLDVVLHVGDYIYETTGDLSFQSGGQGARQVVFSDTAGAIAFKDQAGAVSFYAAQSLSNYRELYQTYRSDLWLQLVHESVPFLFVWDDHEFSNDSWQDTATYFDGKVDETHETTRKKNAERAWFEYQPTELGLAADGHGLAIGGKTPVADSTSVIYGDFRFGKRVHVMLTDMRSYRPDHAIPEDIHPARVAIAHDELAPSGLDPAAKDNGDKPVYTPYVDLEEAALADIKSRLATALVAVYAETLPEASEAALSARAQAQAVGLWSAVEVNQRLADAITAGDITAFDVSETTALPRGATYDHMRYAPGSLFASSGIGARYLVEKRHYEAFQKARLARDAHAQDIMGATQEAWLKKTIGESDATWKVVVSSVSLTPMIVDASHVPAAIVGAPDEELTRSGLELFGLLLPAPFLLSVDQWDGFPDKREALLDVMRAVPNCLCVSGDIHSFYATDHGKGAGAHGVVELTGGGISSESFKGFVRGVVDGLVPGISQTPNAAAVISHLEDFLQDTFPGLTWANNDAHGFVAVTFGASQATATLFHAPISHVTVDAQDNFQEAIAPFERISFTIADGVLSKVS